MNEAQERNLIRFVISNSIPLDRMFEGYQTFCQETGAQAADKDGFVQTIMEEGYRVVVLNDVGYVFGALEKGKTRLKSVPYFKDTPPVDKAEWNQWMAEHAWKPGL